MWYKQLIRWNVQAITSAESVLYHLKNKMKRSMNPRSNNYFKASIQNELCNF
jgi:hypothetical protein